MRTVEPATVDEAAAVLAEASRSGQRVVIRGGGTKFDWSPCGGSADVMLRTTRFNRVLAHRYGDLTATVEAGAVLDDVNRALARRGQWIPLDPAWSDRATIGGLVATNDAGPRRHRYGSPRDLIIGVDIVRADGVRAKAGGIVVKNVAGYDLARLMTGSFGCLAMIVTATFKLYPLNAASRTVIVEAPSNAAVGGVVTAINASQLTPTAVEIQMPSYRLLIRFESIEASVSQQAAEAVRLADRSGARAVIVQGNDEEREWRAHRERPWSGPGTIAKLTMMPGELAATLDALAAASASCDIEVAGRAGLGILLLRLDGDAEAQARVIDDLRQRGANGRGSVTLLRASDAVKSVIDVWGPMGGAFRVMQSVKRAFDPLGVLNPGRGPGGL